MSKKNEIVHAGRILEITPDFTTVQIIVSSACSSCHAKALCGMSEEEEKVIMLPTDPYANYNVGDEVQVCTKMAMGLKAVWISYVIPLAILMILILSLSSVICNEVISCRSRHHRSQIVWIYKFYHRLEYQFHCK